MDFIEKLEEISEQISKTKELLETEEATKTAYVLPFLSALGYNVFNPIEVVPEYTADIGTKKGEKVDYCIMENGTPIIIIECKHWKEDLSSHKSQLHRYYHTTEARFGIITNGITYQFFSDLEEPNKMDNNPFFEFTFDKINETVATELKRFKKENFNVDTIISTASELKYSKLIRDLLSNELKDPSEDFVKYFASKIYPGRVTQKILDQFIPLVQKSTKQLLSDMISDRLKSALENEESKVYIKEPEKEVEEDNIEIDENAKKGIITTDEELEGFRIIQAILRRKIGLERIFARDTKSYFGVLLDDNNRKPICRLHFNGNKKQISLFNSNREEEKIAIQKIEDIYEQEDKLLAALEIYN